MGLDTVKRDGHVSRPAFMHLPFAVLLLGLFVGGCKPTERVDKPSATARTCVRPEEGCACSGSVSQPCFLRAQDEGVCSEGTRRCVDGVWTACLDVETYAADVTATSQALLDVGRAADIPLETCDDCNQLCFRAVDNLDPMDGPLDASNSSGSLLYASPLGITLESGMFGLPPGTNPPAAAGNHPPIVATILPGDSVTTVLDSIAPGINKLDVYFLIDLEASMGEELSTLASELSGGTDYINGATCVDADHDGTPDAHGTGLVEAIRCWARDPWFGAGYFRELPYSPHATVGQVAYQHVQDLDQDETQTQSAFASMAVEDLSAFADVATAEGIALEALATRDGFDMGPGNPSMPARTGCPPDTRGYPCFRDDAVALVLVLTDRPIHNGPSGYAYAANYQQPAAPTATTDLSTQPGAGGSGTPFALGNVSAGWYRFDGRTDASVRNELSGATVGCTANSASGDAVHTFTVSGLAPSATLPVTLSTYDSSFDTVVSLHSGAPVSINSVVVPISNNALTDTEAAAFWLPNSTTPVYAQDIRTSGANSTGLGAEITSAVMGCLGNDATAPDAVYRFNVGAQGADLLIDTEGSSFDTVVGLFRDRVRPVPQTWTNWVPYDVFFEEGWDDWNRNGDGVLCNGGSCNEDWTCDSGSAGRRCGFMLTGSSPRIDDVDCLNGSTCVFVVNAPGQHVRLDNVDVAGNSTFYLRVIAAASVELDSFRCENSSKCGFDFGNSPATSTTDIYCEDTSFCYMVHNTGEMGELDVNDNAKLQIECGANSNCGRGVSDCDDSSLCVLRRSPSTREVGLDCDHGSAACICLEGNSGNTGCRGFCDSNAAAVCANPRGNLVLGGSGPSIPGSVNRVACDDNGGPGTTSRIETGPLDPGTYYLVVKGKRAGERGAYNLHIRDLSVDNRLACNDDEAAGLTHSKISNYALANGTYHAVVKGGAAGAQGDYSLWVGVEPPPFTYTPPTYAQTLNALGQEDIRVSSLVSCDPLDTHCLSARLDGEALAADTGAEVDPGTGVQGMSYVVSPNASDLGVQLMASIEDLTQYLALDTTWRVFDQALDPALDPNLFTTTVAPDNAALCQGISGPWYLGCQMGEVPSYSITFANPLSPGNVPDNASDPYGNGGYGFRLQMVGRTPLAGATAPVYPMDEVAVYLIPNGSLAPPVPTDGTYEQTLESRACPDTIRPDWQSLSYKAHLPLGTSISFRTCSAVTEAQLATCSRRELLTVTSVGSCGGGCPPGSVCASSHSNITPNDACLTFSSSVSCSVDTDCPAGLFCQHDVCTDSDGSPDIATVLQPGTANERWTLYLIELRANAARTLTPTLDYWDVTYTCGVLD